MEIECDLTLAELWSAAGLFETVLLTFFLARIASQQTSFLKSWTQIGVELSRARAIPERLRRLVPLPPPLA